ncbi:MAG: hypothetical protein IPJ65_12510 [Archangiaceae bacterium]|nr:hypothetical protein [Archangiaceae bacterium]
MRFAAALFAVLFAQGAHAQEIVKLFSDQGKTYLRSESAAALVPGTELFAFADAAATRPAGKAIVMEVVGQLARVSFDDDAAKAQAKYVRLGRGAAPAAAANGALPPPPPPPPPPSSAGPTPTALPPRPPALKGVLGRGNYAITVRNDSDAVWSGCELTFPDRRHAPAGAVDAHHTVVVRYDAIQPAPDLGNNWLLVRCLEGEAEMYFDQPQKQNVLRGFAESGRGGGIILHNNGNLDWSQCDLIKPDGTHFVQGSLRAHADDTIRGSLFKPPTGPEIITLTCAQGALVQPVP